MSVASTAPAILVGAVLGSAVLHATWNAIAKAVPDRLVGTALIGGSEAVLAAVAVAVLPLPAAAAWPFVLASTVVQTAYLFLLTAAYRVGDFGRVYPLARGMSPLLVTVASVTFVGDRLTASHLAGVLVICAGVVLLVVQGGLPRRGEGLGLAALTGLAIATYSVLDGVGARRSGDSFAYTAWLFLLHGSLTLLVAWSASGRGFGRRLTRSWRPGVLAGVLSVLAYTIVLWAQTRGALASVAALRETSVVFGALVGALVFGERFGTRRALAAVGIAAGVVLLALS